MLLQILLALVAGLVTGMIIAWYRGTWKDD